MINKYISLLLALFVFLFTNTHAQWSTNSAVNNAISTSTGEQDAAVIVSDGSGGAIITWLNNSSGVYAQHINYAGVLQWTANGVTICTDGSGRYNPKIISDGSGGAIITWWDFRNGLPDIYAQRIDQSGTVQWVADGVAICNATGGQYLPTIVSDGSGGAIITWYDNRNGNMDIYSQRVNAAGTVQWTADGVAICSASFNQELPTIVSDGTGGAIITWYDFRNGSDNNIYAQRVNAAGTAQWTADGVAICSATNTQGNPKIVSDGSGGAIITWMDYRNNVFYSDIYAQLINTSGTVQWTSDGVIISTATLDQDYPSIASDGSGGALITWQDTRTGNSDIYIQSINASGTVQWTADGISICDEASGQYGPGIVVDGSGDAIITWQDTRVGSYSDIYAQRVNASGTMLWTAQGVAISTATFDQLSPNVVSDGSGGAIITWTDYRVAEIENADVYTQNICSDGVIGGNANLPIELLSFTSNCVPALTENEVPIVILNWSTATELINDYFTIERSYDALEWEQIAKMKGAGNSNRVLNYSFPDSFSNTSKTINPTKYYRLTQTDYNGDSKTFNLISCLCATNDIMKFEVYPIPSSESISIDFKNFHHQNLTIQIIDIFGRIIKKEEITDFNNNIYSLDISMFNPGRYFLKVNDLTKSENVIFIKQ